jgi:hypothetical protein
MVDYPTGAVHRPTNNYVWDTISMSWIVAVPATGGGGTGLTNAELRATPVPISGTVSLGAGAAVIGHVIVDTAPTTAITAAALPLPSGASTSANQATEIASLASIDGKLTAPLSVTGPLTDAQLRATPVPVSGTVAVTAAALPLPAGAATSANQATEITSLANLDVLLSTRTKPADQQHVIVDSSAAIAVTGPLTDTQLRATPVPVSGTVATTGSLTDTQLRATPVSVTTPQGPLLEVLQSILLEMRVNNSLLQTGFLVKDDLDRLRTDEQLATSIN